MPSDKAYSVAIHGTVQGVGFRPFLFRLANGLRLTGTVQNTGTGVVLHVEGPQSRLTTFLQRLRDEAPEAADIERMDIEAALPRWYSRFEIVSSERESDAAPSIAPDLATCANCAGELMDPANRRFAYPFLTCTDCGPRFTISKDIPYDRPATTMQGFVMCAECQGEYDSPFSRRFHAQPNACPACGPSLSMPVAEAARHIRQGLILALKGIGGFQLVTDARNDAAVRRLRERKARDWKPLAVMAPDLEWIGRYCHVSGAEARMLRSTAAPIVLLLRRTQGDLAPSIAECSPFFGMMLPYSPLHHLLMKECGFPVVATSGNLSGEPIETDNEEAIQRLGVVADHFLLHDRPIARPVDDSVVRLRGEKPMMVRRARGFVPKPVRIAERLPRVLAAGAHLKNTVAIAIDREIVVSQHIGDLDTAEARRAFENAIDDLLRLFRFQPEAVACDLHPDYASTRWAHACGWPVVPVQHHHAHVAACAAENRITGPYLGVAWDGTGLGTDGTIWGGEFFYVENGRYERIAHLRPFLLPGGEAAVREGWRVAMGMDWLMGSAEAEVPPWFLKMLERRINTPETTSAGRLFDAVAAILEISRESRFEGEAAMKLELAAYTAGDDGGAYPFGEGETGDWAPLLEAIRRDRKCGTDAAVIASRFHQTLANWVVRVARRAGVRQVVLSGGVFQNAYLTDRTVAILERDGFCCGTHSQVPANDGGISLGQAVAAGLSLARGK